MILFQKRVTDGLVCEGDPNGPFICEPFLLFSNKGGENV